MSLLNLSTRSLRATSHLGQFALVAAMSVLALSSLTAPAAEFESIDEVYSRWGIFIRELQELPREERVSRSHEFFATISWEQALWYCQEAYSDAGPEVGGLLKGLVTGKLEAGDPLPAADLASLIGNPSASLACQEAAIRFVGTHADSFATLPAAEQLSSALLRLADSGRVNAGIRSSLERGAVSLWQSDELMDRMMDYCRSDTPGEPTHGVRLLSRSSDARAADSLLGIVAFYNSSPMRRSDLSRSLSALARSAGGRARPLLMSVFRSNDGRVRQAALQALAIIGGPDIWRLVLDEYDDASTGIIDATGEIEEREQRSFYYQLWYAIRLTEEAMVPYLERDDPGAFIALELLDRASRFGLPATRDAILVPLTEWGARQGGQVAERVKSIVIRFQSYPDPTSDQGG